jgi:hypothetical protein
VASGRTRKKRPHPIGIEWSHGEVAAKKMKKMKKMKKTRKMMVKKRGQNDETSRLGGRRDLEEVMKDETPRRTRLTPGRMEPIQCKGGSPL